MKAYYMNDTGSQFCCSKQTIRDFPFFLTGFVFWVCILTSWPVFWALTVLLHHIHYLKSIWRGKKKKNKSTIIDLATFKKPHQSITLGDATLVIKMCFNTPRTRNSIKCQEVSFFWLQTTAMQIYKSGILLLRSIRKTKAKWVRF